MHCVQYFFKFQFDFEAGNVGAEKLQSVAFDNFQFYLSIFLNTTGLYNFFVVVDLTDFCK